MAPSGPALPELINGTVLVLLVTLLVMMLSSLPTMCEVTPASARLSGTFGFVELDSVTGQNRRQIGFAACDDRVELSGERGVAFLDTHRHRKCVLFGRAQRARIGDSDDRDVGPFLQVI